MTAKPPAPPRRSQAEQARFEAALRERIRSVAFNQVLGLTVECLNLPQPRIRFEMGPALIGTTEYRRLHGGAVATALDVAGGLALMVAIAERHADETIDQLQHRFVRMGTIDLRVEYLLPGRGAHFIGTAEVTRLGGRIGSTQMRLVNDQGTLIATGAGNYIVS
jgi:uncharacterized protein (TIGR00369 family)